VLLARHELAGSLAAQNEFIGAKGMQALGFTQRFIKVTLAKQKASDARLRELGKPLGWRENSVVPHMAFLSRKVGREDEYKFLYQGTSRYVHFSTHEILRRAWGQKGEVHIGSNTFSRYWRDFAIYWGFRIFLELVIHNHKVLADVDISPEKQEEMLGWLKKVTPIPIVTSGELESWN
jgi:hypothetical protein